MATVYSAWDETLHVNRAIKILSQSLVSRETVRADFGIAHVADLDRSFTRTGATMGTWAYIAPEQRADSKDKTKYRVRNWPSYDRALGHRGDLTIWFHDDAIAPWEPDPSGA
jgi:hypothetical protein